MEALDITFREEIAHLIYPNHTIRFPVLCFHRQTFKRYTTCNTEWTTYHRNHLLLRSHGGTPSGGFWCGVHANDLKVSMLILSDTPLDNHRMGSAYRGRGIIVPTPPLHR